MKYRRSVVNLSVAAVLSAAVLTATGCGRSDDAQAELDRAEIILNALSNPGSTARPTDNRKRDDLQWVIDRLSGRPGKGVAHTLLSPDDFDRRLDDPAAKPKPGAGALPEPRSAAIDSDSPGTAAAANMLVSRAQAGLAEIQANAHGQVEAALLNQLAVIRAALGEWNALNSQAAGLETYDPEADVRSLEAQIGERQTELAAAQRAKKEADDRIAALEQQAAQLSAQGEEARQREASIRERMLNASQTERLALLEESMTHRRAADDLDKQASALLARAAAERPEADALAGRVRLSESQVRFLREGIANVRDRGEKNRAAAGQARASAAQVAARIDTLITEASTLRSNADAPADEAVRLYGLAQSAAAKAGSKASEAATKGQAAALAGAAAQAVGDVQSARARGLTQFIAVVKAAAEDQYQLPNRNAYAQRATDAQKKHAETREAARTAYTDAIDQFERSASGLSGTQAESIRGRINAVKGALQHLADGTTATARAPQPRTDGDPAGAPAADATATDADTDIAEARVFVQGLIDQARAGNIGSIIDAIAFEDPAEADMARSILPLVLSVSSFNEQCQTTYSADLPALVRASKVPAVQANPMLGMMGQMVGQIGAAGVGLDELKDLNAADLAFTKLPDGKISFLGGDGEGQPTLLAKVEGAWRLWFPRTGMAAGPGAAQMQMFLPMFRPMAAVFDAVGGKIRAGDYADADAMLTDLSARLMGAMGAMPGMDGGDDDADAPLGGGLGGGAGGG